MSTVNILTTMANHTHQLIIQKSSQYRLVRELFLAYAIFNRKSVYMHDKYPACRGYLTDVLAFTHLVAMLAFVILYLLLLCL